MGGVTEEDALMGRRHEYCAFFSVLLHLLSLSPFNQSAFIQPVEQIRHSLFPRWTVLVLRAFPLGIRYVGAPGEIVLHERSALHVDAEVFVGHLGSLSNMRLMSDSSLSAPQFRHR